MNRRILCVDDELNVLEALERNLFDSFEVVTANGGELALDRLASDPPFAVVVSDMRMPNMSGAELLAKIRKQYPDTVRILLTGYADTEAAIAAVNQGGIFRYLCKPCPPAELQNTLEEAITLHELTLAERRMLEGTVAGVVKTLTEVLGFVAPTVFSCASRMRAYVEYMLEASGNPPDWRYEMAAQLALLGAIALPSDLVEKVLLGAKVSVQERRQFERHPETGQRLLAAIPKLEGVAEIVGKQSVYDLSTITDPEVRLGVALLQGAAAVDARTSRGDSMALAVRQVTKEFSEEVAALIQPLSSFSGGEARAAMPMTVAQLRIGMLLDADVVTPAGAVVIPKGRVLSLLHLERLRNFAEGAGVSEPIFVRAPEPSSSSNGRPPQRGR